MAGPNVKELLAKVEALRASVLKEGGALAETWSNWIERPEFRESALNLARYLALRHHDLRPLQGPLMQLGLSSLGRLESRVIPALDAVCATLAVLNGSKHGPWPSTGEFFSGELLLAERTAEVLGPASPNRPVHLLVTCPSEAASDPGFMRQIAKRGVEAIRINCAHDDADAWTKMIVNARAAERLTGRPLKVLMDIAGPKIRTGKVRQDGEKTRVMQEQLVALARPGRLAEVEPTLFAVECTLAEPVAAARPGDRVFFDDGAMAAVVERKAIWGVVVRVTKCPPDGFRVKTEKGLNFPDTEFHLAALTAKDLEDLDFIAGHADGIEFSYVQSADDVAELQDELASRRATWRELSLILKIETIRAVRHLPEIVVRAAGRQPSAIMIARGDLAVEIGFARLAEMQEEILWVGEAAQVPVIWATQVLEHLIKRGTPLRGEMTDAAMSGRAECVLLNKGPHLFEAITELDGLLGRMGEHQHKKTSRLRKLASW